MIRWRADKGGEYTADELEDYRLGTDITQEFAATNTPQQISEYGRVGRTLSGMVRCMLVDNGLPTVRSGELQMMACAIASRIRRSRWKHLVTCFGAKDADISHLRNFGARAFVYIKDVNKLGHTSWEGRVRGFSQNESNSFRIWNPKTRPVVETRSVVFIETQPHLLPSSRRLSSLQGLEAPKFDFYYDSLEDTYSSCNDMIQDAKDHTSALDFGDNDPLLIPTSGGSLPGGATPRLQLHL